MTVLSALLAPLERRVIRDEQLWGAWARGEDVVTDVSPSGVRVTRDSALRLSAVYACVRLIADAIAGMPVDTFVRRDGSRIPLRPRPRWLDEPNSEQDRFTWVHQQLVSLLLDGTTYLWLSRDDRGDVLEAWVVPPERVTMRRGADSDGLRSVLYEVTADDGAKRTLGPMEMFHVQAFSLPGQLKGVPPLEMARNMIGAGLAGQEYGERFFAQGLGAAGVIEVPGELTIEQARELKSDFAKANTGLRKTHLPPVLTAGAKWAQLSISPEQAQFLESRQFSVAEVARFYGVPPHMIGDVERSTSWGTGIEQQGIGFVTYTLMPWLERLEQAYTRHLLLRPGGFVKFNVSGLLRADLKTRMEAHAIGRQWGWRSADEVRAFEDERPLPDGLGQSYMVPLNMAVMGGPAPAEPPANGQPEREAALAALEGVRE